MQQANQAPTIPITTKVTAIECPAFTMLNEQQKQYAYYFTRAAWAGAKICYFQRSYEAPGLMYLFQKIFILQSTDEVRAILVEKGFTLDEVNQIYVYIAAFFQNCGNFKSFGDTKFVPELPKERFRLFLESTKAFNEEKDTFDQIWALVHDLLYNYAKPYGLIDLVEKDGQNSYYVPTLKKEQIEELDVFLHTKNISELNTRIVEKVGEVHILVAAGENVTITELTELWGKKVYLHYGDFAPFLKDVAANLNKAIQYVENDNQKLMLVDYVEHFKSGDMEKHKDSQRHWIKDKGPIIETNIGFIETYLDPMKVRAEFEGFVAVVNQEESKILNNLVEKAEVIIEYLPWPKEFEIAKFSKPDFTSLEVLSFACSGTPVGINIPNYDDIRQNEGFKNVNLGNVYGKPNRDNVRFIEGANLDLFVNYYKESLFITVALHELIGHGSGKLFTEDKDGKLNFENVINPFTNQPVTSFYKQNEHWHARFGELSGGYEECKADAVALYLSTFDDVVQVLLPGKEEKFRRETVEAAWLDIVMGAIKGLEYYSVEQSKWGQPHILASYVIFQCLIQEDKDLVKFTYTEKEGKPYFTLDFAFNKIWTVGKAAIGKLLTGLQVHKSIGDGEGGMKFFNQYTQVNEEMVKLREMVIAHKTQRKIELQPDVEIVDGQLLLKVFPETIEGVIQSHVFHYNGQVDDVKELFLTTQQCFKN